MKVYVGQLGARELLVAANDRKEALEAFGVADDLFVAGCAAESLDPELTALALQNPGVVYERPVWAWRKHYVCDGAGEFPESVTPAAPIPAAARVRAG